MLRTLTKKPTVTLPKSEVATILSSDRRVKTVHLVDAIAPTTAGELADHLCAAGDGDGRSDDRKRYYTTLIQNHLPKLDGWRVIDYDKERKTVERGPNLRGVIAIDNDIGERSAHE